MGTEKITDHWGNEPEYDTDKLPEGAPAKSGEPTPPSGQGGATPKSRPSHQDMWPANPPPSKSAATKGEENDAKAKGEKPAKASKS